MKAASTGILAPSQHPSRPAPDLRQVAGKKVLDLDQAALLEKEHQHHNGRDDF